MHDIKRCDIYLLQLGFHMVAAIGKLVQKWDRDKRRNNTQNNIKTENTQNRKQTKRTLKRNICRVIRK